MPTQACNKTFAKRETAESHVLEQHFLLNVVKCLPCDAAFGMSDISPHFEQRHIRGGPAGGVAAGNSAAAAKGHVQGRK